VKAERGALRLQTIQKGRVYLEGELPARGLAHVGSQ
jgi:hypothetical protein